MNGVEDSDNEAGEDITRCQMLNNANFHLFESVFPHKRKPYFRGFREHLLRQTHKMTRNTRGPWLN